MPKIIKNGVTYIGTSDNAAAVSYDNTSSGLTSTNVQGAIDEVVDEKVDTGEVITFTPEAGVTINDLSSWKTDRLCGISFDIKGITTTAGTMTTIGTVDILPSAVVRTGITNVGSGSHVGIARVNVQGTIGILTESALSSSSSIAFSFIYKSRT